MITDQDYAKDINEVILAERERCAEIAETFGCGWGDVFNQGTEGEQIAAKIRLGVDPANGAA